MTIQLDFTNYELSSKRIARAIYESLAVEGGRQSYVSPRFWTTVSPDMGTGVFGTGRLSKDDLRMKRMADALMSRPLDLKKEYVLSPYYIAPRYTIPSKLIVTAKDSNSRPIEAHGQDTVRKLRIKRVEVGLKTAGQEYVDVRGVASGVPVNTAAPFGYADPWPVNVLLSPLDVLPEYLDDPDPKHRYILASDKRFSKKLRENTLYGPREAILALHDRLSEEAKKVIDQYFSLLGATIHVGNDPTLYTTDNTQVRLQATSDDSSVVLPADLSLEGARVDLDVYYAKGRDIIQTKANVKNLIPLSFARRNAAARSRIILEEILSQFLSQYAPDLPKKEAAEIISGAMYRLQSFVPEQALTNVWDVENERSYADVKRYTGRAIDTSILPEVTDAVAHKVKLKLEMAWMRKILRRTDEEIVNNLIALMVFAITTTYYAAANLWDYLVRAIEAEDPVTGHKQWKYSVVIDQNQSHYPFAFLLSRSLIESPRIVCEDVDSGEEVVLTVPNEKLQDFEHTQFQIKTTTEEAAEGSKTTGSVTLPARCVERHVDSDLHSTYYETDVIRELKKATMLTPSGVEDRSIIYGNRINYEAEPKLIHKSEILST